MNEDAKSQLLKLVKNLGCSENSAKFQHTGTSVSNSQYYSTVVVSFPDGRIVKGAGGNRRKTDAEIAAAMDALEKLRNNHPDLVINWDEINVEAQLGDVLIKLGVHLSPDLTSTDKKSKRLQNLESDSHLERVFDQWKAQGDPDLAIWGNNLGKKRKATLVEALLWRRFRMQVLTLDASKKLQSLLKVLE